MVDIIDVVLAKSLTPQGQIDTYAAKANKAVADAAKAENDMNSLIESLTAAVEEAEENNSAVTEKLQQVDAALESLDVVTDVDDEIDKLAVTLNAVSSANATTKNITMSYPSGKSEVMENVVKYYNGLGNNTDGTMTQKAITEAINSIPTGGGTAEIDLGTENAGKIVVVGQDGKPVSGTISEKTIIDALMQSDDYIVEGVLGLQIDYENRSILRQQDATYLNAGEDFNKYPMYGGCMRCNVADNGRITAFYGDVNYKEDGSNGQVMVYLPKFYYQRSILKSEKTTHGEKVRKETLFISSEPLSGFKIHPLFINEQGQEIQYVLVSAYEGGLQEGATNDYRVKETGSADVNVDKLSSVAGVKPISAKTYITQNNLEKLAANRGNGWHTTTMAFESAIQMLEMIEFGTMNGQSALGLGISDIKSQSTVNCASITGSTSALGNDSGTALSTVNEINGTYTTYTTADKVAISYRGIENPWGNTWRIVSDCNVYGNGSMLGGEPYICSNFDYYETIEENYSPIGFYLPNEQGWISAMGYGNSNYDWVYMPIECINGNSATPVGDNLWVTPNLNDVNSTVVGGAWSFGMNVGPFYYGCDRKHSLQTSNYNGRIMFIPEENNIYQANYNTWKSKMGV